jgi:hypothetical protein
LTTYAVVAASLSKVTEFCYLLSQSVGLVPGDEYQPVIHDSVAGGGAYDGDGPPRFTHPWTISLDHCCQANASAAMIRQSMECIVHRIPNGFSNEDLARAAIVLSQGRLALK